MTLAKFRFRLTILYTYVKLFFKTKIYINEKKIHPMQQPYAGLFSADNLTVFFHPFVFCELSVSRNFEFSKYFN